MAETSHANHAIPGCVALGAGHARDTHQPGEPRLTNVADRTALIALGPVGAAHHPALHATAAQARIASQ